MTLEAGVGLSYWKHSVDFVEISVIVIGHTPNLSTITYRYFWLAAMILTDSLLVAVWQAAKECACCNFS